MALQHFDSMIAALLFVLAFVLFSVRLYFFAFVPIVLMVMLAMAGSTAPSRRPTVQGAGKENPAHKRGTKYAMSLAREVWR
jgi:hypothetical protein